MDEEGYFLGCFSGDTVRDATAVDHNRFLENYRKIIPPPRKKKRAAKRCCNPETERRRGGGGLRWNSSPEFLLIDSKTGPS